MITPTTHEEVYKVIQELRKTVTGANRISAAIVEPLPTSINNCFEGGIFPDELKTA